MIFATAGHVDHGKTSLVKALTNIDTDRLKEEKARGLTIDLGFAYTEQNGHKLGFVDVPGHARFISNMLAGVSSIDHALLIVAADDGPMPQTIEHLAILQLLGIRDLSVVITKVDRVSAEHLSDTRNKINALLANSFYPDPNLFETSTQTGLGVDSLSEYLFSLRSKRATNKEQFFRLAIDRKFAVKGAGIVVTGSVFSGEVEVGAELLLMPGDKKVRVRGLHRQDTEADIAYTGDRCALNIAGDVALDDIQRGHWLTSNPGLPVSARIDVEVRLLPEETERLRTGAPMHVHLGAQHTQGRLFFLDRRHLSPGEKTLAQLKLNTAISSCAGDKLVLRDQSAQRTLGGGIVIDPVSVARGRSKPARQAFLEGLANNGEPDLASLLKHCPTGLDLKAFYFGQNIKPVQLDYPADNKGFVHHPDSVKLATAAAMNLIKDTAIGKQALAKSLNLAMPLLDLALQQLIRDEKIEQAQGKFTLAKQRPELSKPAATLWAKVSPILMNDPMQPPVISELAKKVNLPPAALEKLLGECISQGLLVKPVKNRFFLVDAMAKLRALASQVASDNGGEFTVIQFRDASGMGRNLCIELLEHLDNKGFTKRLGDTRIIQDTSR